jgi:hypothetical protein
MAASPQLRRPAVPEAVGPPDINEVYALGRSMRSMKRALIFWSGIQEPVCGNRHLQGYAALRSVDATRCSHDQNRSRF